MAGNQSGLESVYGLEGVMKVPWVSTWQKIKKPLKTGWLVAAALMALYFGTARLYEGRGVAAEEGSGLTAAQREPTSRWQQSSDERGLDAARKVGIIGGGAS